jgi:hypothetical protein
MTGNGLMRKVRRSQSGPGANAVEVMAAVQMAMIAGLPYTAFTDAILTHSTMAEGLKFLFLSQLTGGKMT